MFDQFIDGQRDRLILLARVLLVALYISTGWEKITGFSSTVGYMRSVNAPAPVLSAGIAAVLEFFGGIALLLGIATRPVALLLVVFTLGTALQSLKRPADLAARFGGEEIAVLLPSTSLSGAMCVGKRIRGLVERLAIAHPMGCEGRVTVSVGVAEYEGRQADIASLIARADEALYRSKCDGRNRVEASSDAAADQAAA